jgi:hypothetical protein
MDGMVGGVYEGCTVKFRLKVGLSLYWLHSLLWIFKKKRLRFIFKISTTLNLQLRRSGVVGTVVVFMPIAFGSA